MPEMSSQRQTEVIRAQLLSKAVLRPDEMELYELTQLAGVIMDQQVFKIILDLLKLNVPPVAIIQTLRSMCSPHHHDNANPVMATPQSAHLLDRGEPHPNVTLSRGGRGNSQGLSQDVSQRSTGARSTLDDYQSRAASKDGQDRRSGSRGQAKASSSDQLGGSSYSSYTSTNTTRDNSHTQSRLGSFDKREPSPASNVDRYVTSRQRNSTSDYTSYRERDKSSKKRSSYHN